MILFFTFPNQNSTCIYFVSHACRMPHLFIVSDLITVTLFNRSTIGVQITRFLTAQLSQVVFFIEGPNISHASLLSNTLHLCLPLTREIKFHAHVKAGEIVFPYILVPVLVNNQLDTQFFFIYVYFYSLHVSGSHVPIIRRINCINTTSGICHCV